MVHFVGAGCGAADLITIRGMNLIKEADVIIYTGSLVNPALLQYAGRDAQIHNSASMTLEDVMELMRKSDEEGKKIVRLHTGEPSLYGAVREQMDELERLGIGYDSTPGVTACFGAAASLNLEYTLPGVSQSLIITRMEGRTPVPARESIEKLAMHRASMAVYLSAGMLKQLSDRLLAGGYEADTPAAIVYKATWPEEKRILCTVGTLAEEGEKNGITQTAVILVGEAIAQHGYDRSRLYAPDFSTQFRPAAEDVEQERMLLHIISFTARGRELSLQLMRQMAGSRYQCRLYSKKETEKEAKHDVIEVVQTPVSEWAGSRMETGIPMLFIGAAGIAVRAVAPHLGNKLIDPPVLVMDETGQNVIPILSGHVGGANEMARNIATLLGARAVITTATDLEGKFRADIFAVRNDLTIVNREGIARVSGALLEGKRITCSVEEAMRPKADFSHAGEIEFVPYPPTSYVDLLILSENPEGRLQDVAERAGLILRYKPYILGIGCKKGKSQKQLEQEADRLLAEYGIGYDEVSAVASIDLKKEEEGLMSFCREKELRFVTFSPKQLSEAEGEFTASEFVRRQTGVDNVCERAAVTAGGKDCVLLCKKKAGDGITMALAEKKRGLNWNE